MMAASEMKTPLRPEKPELPLSVLFDDLMRHIDLYMSYNCDNEFLQFIINQEECRKKWAAAENECARLQGQVQLSQAEIERQEKKILETRRQLELKLDTLSRFERDKNSMDIRFRSAITLINSYMSDMRIGSETKERLAGVKALLEGGELKKAQQVAFTRSPGGALDTISEAETTDLSMTQSEDDLDVSTARTRNRRGGKRYSGEILDSHSVATGTIKRRKSVKHEQEGSENDQVITQTIVSIPRDRDRPIHAVSTMETITSTSNSNSNRKDFNKKESHMIETLRPSAPPNYGTATSESESDASAWHKSPSKPAYNTRLSASKQQQQQQQYSPQTFGRTLSTMQLRSHAFVQKTVFKPETCEPCGKRIKFNKTKLCCRDCKATCHPECKGKVPIPCVPSTTPGHKNNKMGSIADYSPKTHPMVPALIQHCVNEVEARGASSVGLYRIPGGEKEVRELKDRFLRGKGIPNLARYDIHGICGCIKLFLKSLEEPLVGRFFWHDFQIAADMFDQQKRKMEISRIIQDLPEPNQDTLAFVVLHLQKIGTSEEFQFVKMSIPNLAKIFGPTIIGYSCNDIETDQSKMLRETKQQQIIMEALLDISSEFWQQFLFRPSPSVSANHFPRSISTTSGTPIRVIGSPITRATSRRDVVENNNNNENVGGVKKIYFTDDSPSPSKLVPKRPAKTYFD